MVVIFPAARRELCEKHYARFRRHGDAEYVKQIHGDDLSRVMAKIRKTGDGCWEWLGHVIYSGYGQVRIGARLELAHRAMYRLVVGPIPVGLELDHLCHNRRCVNPEHLEPVTHSENLRRRRSVEEMRDGRSGGSAGGTTLS